jgi:DNA polymerase-1
MTIALLDGDIIAFRSAAAVQDQGDELAPANPANAHKYAEVMIKEWTLRVKPHKIIMCFSDTSRKYFRHDILPEYKANRKDIERPSALISTIKYLESKYTYVRRAGLEADDLLGIMGTSPSLGDTVVVSIDKDMLTLPCKVYNPDKMRRPVRMREGMCDMLVLQQAMTGDSTDNYKGIPGVGPKKAEAILAKAANPYEMWTNVLQAFLDAGLTAEYAIQMVRMARILRHGDYNETTGEVRLWHPNKPVWMTPSAHDTTNSEASKSTTTLSKSVEDSPATKPQQLPTQSSTSVDTEVKTTEQAQPPTSKRQGGTSTDSSNKSKRKKTNEPT